MLSFLYFYFRNIIKMKQHYGKIMSHYGKYYVKRLRKKDAEETCTLEKCWAKPSQHELCVVVETDEESLPQSSDTQFMSKLSDTLYH